MSLLSRAPEAAKAIAAFVSTAAAGAIAALLIGSPGDASITPSEWVAIVSSVVVATAAVFSVPNRPAEGAAPVEG